MRNFMLAPRHALLLCLLVISTELNAQISPFPAYRIGSADVLSISVWQQPELSRLVTVRPDGFISFPLLGDMMVAGMTPLELRNTLAIRLEDYVNIMLSEVTVSVDAVNSYTIAVMGQVRTPGRFSFQSQVSVLDVLAEAGGFTQFADVNDVVVLRTENGVTTRLPFNYGRVIRTRAPEPDISLLPGDIVVVP